MQNRRPFALWGRPGYRARSIASLLWSTIAVSAGRLRRGPLVSGWAASFEIANDHLRRQNIHAFDLADIQDGREYTDALVFHAPVLDLVDWQEVGEPIKGIWFDPPAPTPEKVILYFHGGGYAYFARAHIGFIANIARFTGSRVFALDYPLIPEHPYPAQLESALSAYQWLMQEGWAAEDVTLMGDSAGGNLCLALLLKLRELGQSMPASAVAICPWTDVSNSGASMSRNEPFDWVEKRMAEKWARWFLAGRSDRDPLISPLYADLRGLPPIYLQAGGREILIDMIRQFHEVGKRQGAAVTLDVWPSMTHDFQAYGDQFPESRDALGRIAQFIHTT